MTEVMLEVLDLIQTGIDLANSVRDDLKAPKRTVSTETILLMSQFRTKHDKLGDLLDVVNEVN